MDTDSIVLEKSSNLRSRTKIHIIFLRTILFKSHTIQISPKLFTHEIIHVSFCTPHGSFSSSIHYSLSTLFKSTLSYQSTNLLLYSIRSLFWSLFRKCLRCLTNQFQCSLKLRNSLCHISNNLHLQVSKHLQVPLCSDKLWKSLIPPKVSVPMTARSVFKSL